MNRKQKKELRQRQSTRQLMGIDRLTGHGVSTPHGELVYFLIRPDNLSVLSPEVTRGRIQSLMELLRATDQARLLALDSSESFSMPKIYYQQRLEQETNPAIRALLELDKKHLDSIQTTTASAREFLVCYTLDRKNGENTDTRLAQMAKDIRDRGFHVRAVEEQDVMRMFAVYYAQDVTTEHFDVFDGESVVRTSGV